MAFHITWLGAVISTEHLMIVARNLSKQSSKTYIKSTSGYWGIQFLENFGLFRQFFHESGGCTPMKIRAATHTWISNLGVGILAPVLNSAHLSDQRNGIWFSVQLLMLFLLERPQLFSDGKIIGWKVMADHLLPCVKIWTKDPSAMCLIGRKIDAAFVFYGQWGKWGAIIIKTAQR